MFLSAWTDKADCRHCYTAPNLPDDQALMEYLL